MAACWRADEERTLDGGQRIFDAGLIQAVCVRPYFAGCQSQDIGPQDDFGDGCVEDGKQMRVVSGCDFPVPPALGDVDHLARRNLIMMKAIGKWVDEGNIGRSGNAVHQLGGILMVVRLHDVARAEEDVQQRHVVQRIQLLGGEDVDVVAGILLDEQVIVDVRKELG